MKKLFYAMVATVMCCSYFTACSKDKQKNETLSSDNVQVWSCDASIKVLQKFLNEETGEALPVEEGYYDGIKQEPEISIAMLRGEYESGQVIITPNVDINYYNATISDLKLVNGEAVISAETSIDIYHERYMPVEASHSNTNVPAGYYPDALVPMHAVVEYEHNKIKANENQGVYITVESGVEQEVGVYEGCLTLDFKDFVQTIPVSVNVLDATVSQATHLKSIYLSRWNYMQGELDTSKRAYDAYYDALKEYRLATSLDKQNSFTEEGIKNFVEMAYEELQDPRLSCIGIPLEGSAGQRFNVTTFKKYLRAIAEKSFETDFNMFERMAVYNAHLDEPLNTKVNAQVIIDSCTNFNKALNSIADEYEANASITANNKTEIIASLRKIPHIITTHKVPAYEGYIDTYCPLYSLLNTEEQRQQYFNDPAFKELWWYGCNNPVSPYVTFHLENENTVGARLLGWMSAEYGISGILNWAVNEYGAKEDYFNYDSAYKGTGPYMEGMLFYPGGQYGLDEPIPTLRINALRDGIEEYELLYALKQKYATLGLDFNNFVASLTGNLYSGAQVIAQVENLVDARKTLLDASIAMNGPAQLCLVDSKDLGNGTVETTIYAKSGYELKNNGKVLTGGMPNGEGMLYTITSKLDNDVNSLKIEYVVDGKTYSYTKLLPGKASVISAAEFYQGFKKDTASVTSTLVTGESIGLSGQAAKLEIGAQALDYQMFAFENKSVFSKLKENVNKVVFAFYNDSEEDFTLTMDVKYTKQKLYLSIPEVVLTSKKMTYIEMPLLNIDWEKYGEIGHIRFTCGNQEGQPARMLYLKDIVVYDK